MKRVSLLSLGLAFAAAAIFPAQAADKVTWTFSLYGPPRAATVTFEHLAKVAKEKSNGNFIINIRYNEQLGEAKEFLDGIKVNSYQGAFVAYSYAPAKTPLQGVLDMPFLPIPDLVSQERVQDGYQAWKPVAEELAKWNGMHFMTVLLPQYEFMGGGKPPRNLEDWKGMRVRALGGLGDAMKLLGAVPVSVSAPEVYTALERGMFQAASFPFAYSFTASEASRTVPVALALFPGVFEVPWGDIAAASLLASLPPIVIVVAFQRYLVRGLLAGALRE